MSFHLPDLIQNMKDLAGDVSDAVSDVADAASDAMSDVTDAVSDVTDAVSDVTDAVSDAVSDVSDAMSDVTDAMSDVTDAVSDVTDAVSGAVDAVSGAVDAVSDVVGAVSGVVDAVSGVVDAVSGVADAVSGAVASVADAVGAVAGAVASGVDAAEALFDDPADDGVSALMPASRSGARKPPAVLPDPGFPVVFSFQVVFGEKNLKDETSFQEVSGIGAEMDVEPVREGGENRFVHRLPTGVKYNPLVLKRGIGPANSALVRWCRTTFELGLGQQIRTAPLTVYLLDPDGNPLRAWLFADAYPAKWDPGTFDAHKNDIAIETIQLNYTYCNRIL